MYRILLVFILFSSFLTFGYSQTTMPKKYVAPDTRILFVFDASQSMMGMWESDRKINIARKVLISMIDSLQTMENVQMALRVYGHQSPVPPQDCNDTRLEVPFAKGNASRIRQELRYINPKGTTPIAYSLQMAGKDFPQECIDCRNIIILITDGIEACDGDPCEVSRELQKLGIVLKPFVIGIGIDEGFKDTFDCIGHYYNASNEEKFKEVMEVVISQALNSTTAQVNLLDKNGHPTETNVNMTFFDHFSGKVIYNYVHTMNYRGVPDTLVLDHLITYDIRINTIPPVYIDSAVVYVGKHTVLAADCPQGTLLLKVDGGAQYRGMPFIVRKHKQAETLHVQEINKEENYIVGKYDIEIPVLPRILLENVEINQSTTTTVTIPRPGILNLIKPAPGYGSIYIRKDKNQEDFVCNIDNSVRNETIILQPGIYRIVFRAINAKQTLFTVNKTLEIKSGGAEVLQLY
ncbi:MAG: VWA domain-containing protein [Bacteroidales bacterium]|nr:VWA domain-containing protein [Bacteroidales bacterium]MBN2819339.1 VWA domain-containing protein [Bacteroidales bacterium]